MAILKKNQTLLDFAVQFGGDTSDWLAVALANGLSLTDEVAPGTELAVVSNTARVTNYLMKSEVDITGGAFRNDLGGIGYMQIGTNFRVS
jgi:hypothetical protein